MNNEELDIKEAELIIEQWKWEGDPLPVGSYKVVLQAIDLNWKTTRVVRELGRFEVVAAARRPRIVAWSEPSTRKIPLSGRPRGGQVVVAQDEFKAGDIAPLQVHMAQNEHEAIQAAHVGEAIQYGSLDRQWVP